MKTSSIKPVMFEGVMSKVFIRLTLYIALFVYLYSFSEYGLNIWDEGSYAYGALRTFNGQMPLRDFNPIGYLPGRYFFGALFFKLFGVHIQSLRLGAALYTPAMVLMVYAVACKIMPRGFAVMAALAMLSAPAMYYNRFYPFFCVLLMYLLIEVADRKQVPWFFFLLLSTITGFFFKPEVALFSMIIGVMVLTVMYFQGLPSRPVSDNGVPLTQVKVWSLGLLSIGAVVALSAYFSSHGIIDKFFNLLWKSYKVWGNPFPAIFPFMKLLVELGPHRMFERVLFYLPALTYLSVISVLIFRFTRGGFAAISLHLLIILSFGICAFGLVVWRAGFDNLLRTLPPFYILFCYLSYLVWKKFAVRWPSNIDGHDVGLLIKKITLNVLIACLPFLFFYEMNFHQGFYAGSVGAVRQERTLLRLNRLEVYTNPTEAKWLNELVSHIQAYSREGDPIFVLPLNPIFYFLTNRVNPTPHDWILPGMFDEKGQKEIVEQLKARMPKLIIYADIAIDGKENRRFANYAPIIHDFIVKGTSKNSIFWTGTLTTQWCGRLF